MSKTKTRLTSLLLAVFMIFGMFSAFPNLKTSAETFGDYTYTILEDGTAEITDYVGNATELEIPSEIEGYVVSSIGHEVFRDYYNLVSVIIPNSVVNIGAMAFQDCRNLTTVVLPDNITVLGYQIFADCLNLKNITIPDSVVTIGESAFRSCSSLTELKIPENVTKIQAYAFQYCSGLTSFVIPSGVTSIKQLTFQLCSFSFIEIPNTVESIGFRAFDYCDNLTDIVIPRSVTSISEHVFDNCISLKSIHGYKDSYAETYALENNIPFIILPDPTKLSATLKKVYPTSAKVFIERTQGDEKGAISYVLLKGDYADVDFSTMKLADMKNHPDFVKAEYSNYTKNFNFNITNLDRNTVYTVIPFTVKMKYGYFGLGENVTFTTPDISLETTLKTVTADTAKFKISRTGAANGALGYVLLKGDVAESYKTLEEYQNLPNFVANQTSNWTGGVTVNVKGIESGETYTVVPYTQKGNVYSFGLGENLTFTTK
jgi:hypothetical protein